MIRQKTKAAVFMGRDTRNILAQLQTAHTARLHLVIYSWRRQHIKAAPSSPAGSAVQAEMAGFPLHFKGLHTHFPCHIRGVRVHRSSHGLAPLNRVPIQHSGRTRPLVSMQHSHVSIRAHLSHDRTEKEHHPCHGLSRVRQVWAPQSQ